MIEGKLWGRTETIESNEFTSLHRAVVNAGYRCSRHKHERKWNGFFVESGHMRIRVYQPTGTEDVTELRAGQYTAVGPGIEHRFECIEDAVLFEVYWPATLSEDIVRADEGGLIEGDA